MLNSTVLETLNHGVKNGIIRGFDLTIHQTDGSTSRHSHKPAPTRMTYNEKVYGPAMGAFLDEDHRE